MAEIRFPNGDVEQFGGAELLNLKLSGSQRRATEVTKPLRCFDYASVSQRLDLPPLGSPFQKYARPLADELGRHGKP